MADKTDGSQQYGGSRPLYWIGHKHMNRIFALMPAVAFLAACATTPTMGERTGPQTQTPYSMTGAPVSQSAPTAAAPAPTPVATAPSSSSSSGAIATFLAACQPNLGNPGGVRAYGLANGYVPILNEPGSFLSVNSQLDRSVQVYNNNAVRFQCAITRSDVANPTALRDAFFSAVGLPTGSDRQQTTIGGQRYEYLFDTQGGEALLVTAI